MVSISANRAAALQALGFSNPVALAPMSGVTDAPFRRLAAALGAGLVVSEMTASEALVEGHPEARLRAEAPGNATHVVQLAGREAHWMAAAARLAEVSGAEVIDINMGCPARRVTTGLAGSALMRNLDHALRLIEAVVKAVAVPVTLKMRLGWDDRSRNAPTLARRAEAAGVRMITVHGRTRCQFYDGTADWTAVRAVRDAVTLPLIVNGDIDSVASARAALAASGADGVMIGRGAQGQPWLLGHIAAGLCGHAHPPLQNDEKYKITAEYYEDSLSFYGKNLGGRQARKHLAWALERTATEVGAPAAVLKAQRAAVLTADDPDVVLARLRTAFDALSAAGAAAPRRAA